MRPLFAIKLAAGLTFGFALLYTIVQSYGVHMASNYIERFKPEGHDLERWQRDQEDFFGGAVRSGAVAVLQLPILVYARKLRKQSQAT